MPDDTGFMLEHFTAERKPRDPPRPYIILFDVSLTDTQVQAAGFIFLCHVPVGAKLVFKNFGQTARVIARVPPFAGKPGELIFKPIAFERVG